MPYVLDKIDKEGVSGYLRDLKIDWIKGRYGFDTIKVYVPREDDQAGECMVPFSSMPSIYPFV